MNIFIILKLSSVIIYFLTKLCFSYNNNNLKSSLIMKKDIVNLKSLSYFNKPKNENQIKYIKYLNDSKIKLLFAVGPAGTGKTMFACNTAISELKKENIDKIVITRPVVTVEEDIGFLPGNINKKMDPWTRPIFDVFLNFFSQKDIDLMLQNNIIEISPLAYMRGRTFKNSFIIADEMQNSSPNQMLMLTTRIGEGSKMVITGDLKQSDKGQNSGLSDFIKKYKSYNNIIKHKTELENNHNETTINNEIKIIEFNNSDIERSQIVKKVLEIYSTVEENSIYNLTYSVPQIKNSSTTILTKTAENKKNVSGCVTELFMSSPFFSDSDAALIPIHHMSNNSKYKKYFY